MLTVDIANSIIKETASKLHYHMNIMDVNGVIIASTDDRRLYTVHEGAQSVLETGTPLIVTSEDVVHYQDVRPGINMPIYFQDELVGVVGITGEPEQIKELSEMAKLTTELLIKQNFLISHKGWLQNSKQTILEEILLYKGSLADITSKLEILGYELQSPYLLIMIEPNVAGLNRKDFLTHVEQFIDTTKSFVTCTEINRFAVLTSSISSKKLVTSAKKLYTDLHRHYPELRMMYSPTFHRLDETKGLFDDCCIVFANQRNVPGMLAYEDYEMDVLLADVTEERAHHFTYRLFASLKEKEVATLEAFFAENGSSEQTAKRLKIHRNTLKYRLESIQEKTKLNPRNVREAFELQLALKLLRLDTRA
ncbi:CdaR family transcriptional regulator [Geomicrobium sediminis]|uniref:Carbohydrate diacid regulator n=1 Tax=Geomicrobium sediminis TaxID=1347788 RepID=A0ABS2PA94_9BACL|nr:sugar diacid recognition domain-containing protein [Geomicrobium sediminis]MBM7632310.1 carbohydrate diacid regulator [Geomicrobium sediminis]